jgi:hypothetical protein
VKRHILPNVDWGLIAGLPLVANERIAQRGLREERGHWLVDQT